MFITPTYLAQPNRYDQMKYNRCGKSGIQLPAISLGLWHNFGAVDSFENGRAVVRRAFDLGVTHFDLANNYGPPYGSAEETFGRIFEKDLRPHRDELIISSKAGWDMWPGPYGNFGSRKYLIASLDQSLKRMGLEYVDIFYHHRPDPDTPLEETMGALDQIVRSGKALYVGVSQYSPDLTKQAIQILREMGTRLLIHQPNYNLLDRWVENGLLDVLAQEGVGAIVFSPLAQGLLTNRYLKGIPAGSRASRKISYLKPEQVKQDIIEKVRKLDAIASRRGQSMAQMAIAWVLRQPAVTSALVGASSVEQLEGNVASLKNLEFSSDELKAIDQVVAG